MQCPAQAAFDGPERSQAEGPQRASVGLSWARGKGSRAQALFGHEPSRAWARLVQSLPLSRLFLAGKFSTFQIALILAVSGPFLTCSNFPTWSIKIACQDLLPLEI